MVARPDESKLENQGRPRGLLLRRFLGGPDLRAGLGEEERQLIGQFVDPVGDRGGSAGMSEESTCTGKR
jgi:hypothetical protein